MDRSCKLDTDNIRADILVDILEHILAFVLQYTEVVVRHTELQLVEVVEPQFGFAE